MKTLAKAIEMISWTEESGRIHPVRFKIESATGEKLVYAILRVHTMELDRIAGNKLYRFICEIELNQTLRLCELRYEIETCRWYLFKL